MKEFFICATITIALIIGTCVVGNISDTKERVCVKYHLEERRVPDLMQGLAMGNIALGMVFTKTEQVVVCDEWETK